MTKSLISDFKFPSLPGGYYDSGALFVRGKEKGTHSWFRKYSQSIFFGTIYADKTRRVVKKVSSSDLSLVELEFWFSHCSIFDGMYGSREENALEIQLDLLESQKDTIQVIILYLELFVVNIWSVKEAHFRWSQARVLAECAKQQVSGNIQI